MSNKSKEYKQRAAEFGCQGRFGRFGVKFGFPKVPAEVFRSYKLVRIIPLDGWITKPKEVARLMKERGYEL